MIPENWYTLPDAIRGKNPLIHCITNPISINQCANGILAIGGRPMMAEHPAEVEEITATADALVLNLGNITDTRMASMVLSLAVANQKQIPVVVDMVGIAASGLRRRFLRELLSQGKMAVLKGNGAEVMAMGNDSYRMAGVDTDYTLSVESVEEAAIRVARTHGAVVLVSGKMDIVTDGRALVRITNGSPRLTTVTGTGCLLGALCGCVCAVAPGVYGTAVATVMLGLAGEMAETAIGSGSYAVAMMDALSTMDGETLEKGKRISVEKLEIGTGKF